MAQKILLVDDDEGFLLAARRLLEAAGYHVTVAPGAEEARRCLDAEKPDLLLLDVIMPGKDGFAFAEEVARDEKLSDLRIVLVTAVAESPGQILHAFESNMGLEAVDVLPKSQAHTRLIETVRAALGPVQAG